MLKENAGIFADYICGFFNESIKKSTFPFILKNANVTPFFKKGYRSSKVNYRPVSILRVISNIFKKLLWKQIIIFLDPLLSKYKCGFRKGVSAQHCLLAMFEKWKNSIDKGKVFGALLTDLSKAFDCLPHELIIAKLNAYGFNLPALKLMHSYLSHRKQSIRSTMHIVHGRKYFLVFHKALYLGLFCLTSFNLSDLFLVISDTDFSSCADDNTIYDSGNSIDEVISYLQESAEHFFQWFSHNQMKEHTEKCHLIVSTNEPIEIRVGESLIKSSIYEKLLGVKIDSKVNFDTHVKGLCKKAKNKLRALARATPYMSLKKRSSS